MPVSVPLSLTQRTHSSSQRSLLAREPWHRQQTAATEEQRYLQKRPLPPHQRLGEEVATARRRMTTPSYGPERRRCNTSMEINTEKKKEPKQPRLISRRGARSSPSPRQMTSFSRTSTAWVTTSLASRSGRVPTPWSGSVCTKS